MFFIITMHSEFSLEIKELSLRLRFDEYST